MKNRWQKAVLCQESKDRIVMDYILSEVERRSWWDPLAIFSPTDKISYHMKLHQLDTFNGKWLIDYTNTARITKKWSEKYQKYIRIPPVDMNGVPSDSWNYNDDCGYWYAPYMPPFLNSSFGSWCGDSVWVWSESKKHYRMSKELCEKYVWGNSKVEYDSTAYYDGESVKHDI